MVSWAHVVRGSPGGARTVLGFSLGTLTHRQAAFAVELVGVEKPARLFRGQGHFLAILRRSFLLPGLWPERLVFLLLVIASRARRHVGGGNAPFELFHGFAQLLALVGHAVEALLHFTQAVHELCNAAVQDLGVMPGVGIGVV